MPGVAVARGDPGQGPGPRQGQPAANEVVDDDTDAGDAGHLAQQAHDGIGLQVMDHERGMGHVEGAVGERQAAAIADME